MVNAVPELPELIVAIDAYAAMSDADDWSSPRLGRNSVTWISLPQASMKGNFVLDGRNCLEPSRVQAAGLHYAGVGRGVFVDRGTIYLPHNAVDSVAATAGPV